MRLNKNKISILLVLLTVVFGSVFSALNFSQAAPAVDGSVVKQIDMTAYVVSNDSGQDIPNGDYDVRFALYSKDRTTTDPYPSNADAGRRLWVETQKVTVNNGQLSAYLGSVTPFPVSVNFNTGDYYLGIQIGTDSEMVPRKKIAAVPTAMNSSFLDGAQVGTAAGDIPQLGSGGKLDIAILPTGTSGNVLILASQLKKYLPVAGGSMSGTITFASGQTFGGATSTELGYLKNLSGNIQTQLNGKLSLDGSDLASPQGGELLYFDGGKIDALARGNDQEILKMVGGMPTWILAGSGGMEAHNLLDGTWHGDTEAGTVSRGALVVGQNFSGANKWAALTAGSLNQILRINASGDAEWWTPTFGSDITAGTLLQKSGSTLSVKTGTLTDGYLCTYDQTNGALVCNTDPTAGNHPAVTLAGQNYLSLDGSQQITVGQINLASNVTGTLPIGNGGTGQTTRQASIDALTNVAAATNEYVLTKDTTTGNAIWKVVPSGFANPLTTRGDLMYRDASGTTRLGLGGIGTVLTSNGTDAQWVSPTVYAATGANSDITSLIGLTTALPASEGGTGQKTWGAGDAGSLLYYSSGDSFSKLSRATQDLRVLMEDSTNGPYWGTVSGAGAIGGSGQAGYAAYWSDSSTLSNEQYLAVSRGGTGVGSLASLKSAMSLDNVQNTALTTWTGNTAISSIGTITIGTWHGNSIADAYIDNNLTINGGAISNSDITLKTGTTQTTDGQITWDSSNQYLVVGNGTVSPAVFRPGIGAGGISSITAGSGLNTNGGANPITGTGTLNINLLGTAAVDHKSSDSGLEFSSGQLTMLTGCGDTQVLAYNGAGYWECKTFVSGSTAIINLGHDGTTYSTVSEIDFNSPNFSLPAPSGGVATISLNPAGILLGDASNTGSLSLKSADHGYKTNFTADTQTADINYILPPSLSGSGAKYLSVDASTGAMSWSATGSGLGSVYNVASGDGLTGGPITGSGTLSISLAGTVTDHTRSTSGLEFTGGQLTMLSGCAANQVLQWNGTNNDWECGAYISGTTAIININGDSSISTIDFNTYALTPSTPDFTFTDGSGIAAIGIDYAHSGITRSNQNENIANAWNFQNTAGITLGKQAGTNVPGSLAFMSAGSSNSYETTFTTGTQAGNIAYTLPTSLPGSGTKFLGVNSSGVMDWVSSGGTGGIGTVTDVNIGNGLSAVDGTSTPTTDITGVGTVNISLLASASNTHSVTSAASGLEFEGANNQLALLQGCSSNDVMMWTGSVWQCTPATGTGGTGGVGGSGSNGQVALWTTGGNLTGADQLAVTKGGTGTGTAFTQGSMVFAGASGVYSQDNSNLFWDAADARLGIGTALPSALLSVGATSQFQVNASGELTTAKITDTALSNGVAYVASNELKSETYVTVGQGGLGTGAITGIVKGTGTTYGAATAGTDYAKPNTASEWSANQTFDDGNFILKGSTSGTTILKANATAGSTTFTFPTTSGIVITNGDTGTVTNTMLNGSIANGKLANSTISGVALGNNLSTLTIGTGLSGTSYNGSGPVTIAVNTEGTVAADFNLPTGQAVITYVTGRGYITSYTETDPIVAAINGIVKSSGSTISAATAGTDYAKPNTASEWSANQTFDDGNFILKGSTSGTTILKANATAGSTTFTFPTTSGIVITNGDTGTVTNTMLNGSIANGKLANSTISGVALGNNLSTLTIGTGLSGTSYNGSGPVTIAVNTEGTVAADSNLPTGQAVITYVTGQGYITGNQSISPTGDITGSGTTSIATTIGAGKVTLANMANMSTASFLGRNTGSTGAPEVLSESTVQGMLGLGTAAYTASTDYLASSFHDSLDSLSNVTITSKANGDIIKWDSTAGKWINVSFAAAGGMSNPMMNTGDIIYSNSGSTPAALPDVAAGQPFVSGGIGVAPRYAGYTFSAMAAQTYTFPTTTATLARTDAAQTFTGNQTFSGQLLGANGAVGAPEYSFTNDPTTGMFLTAAGQLSFAVSGTDMFDITSTNINFGSGSTVLATVGGKVGIGSGTDWSTVAPAYLVSLDGTQAQTLGMQRHTTSNTAGNNLTLQAGGATLAATDKGGGDLIMSSGISTGTGSSKITFQTYPAAASTGTSDNSPLTRMIIAANGNVGIGSTTPGAGLDIEPTALSQTTFYSQKIGLNSSGQTFTTWAGIYVAAPTGTITNKYALITQDTAGNVGIGLTAGNNPAAQLSVGTNSQFQVGTTGNVVTTGTITAPTFTSVATTALNIDSGTTGDLLIGNDTSAENIKIGTTNYAKAISIGNSNASASLALTGGTAWSVTAGGNLTTTGLGTFGTLTASGTTTINGNFTQTGTTASLTDTNINLNTSGSGATSIGNASGGALILNAHAVSSWTNTGYNLAIGTATAGSLALNSSGTDVLNINVGTGTATPTNIGTGSTTGAVTIGSATAAISLSGTTSLKTTQTSGTLLTLGAPSAVTVASALIGQSIDLSTNYTAVGQNVTGQTITLPAVANTGAGTYVYKGLTISGGHIQQNTGAGIDNWTGLDVTMPDLSSSAAGTLTSKGVNISNSTATSTGSSTTTSYDLSVADSGTLPGGGNRYGVYSTMTATVSGGTTATNYAGYFSSTGVGGSGGGAIVNNYGGYFTAAGGTGSGGTINNYGAYITASGGTNNYALVIPSGGGNVGIGTVTPTGNLAISQTATAAGALKGIVYTGAVNTNQTASTEIPSLTLTTAGRQWATGALTTQREVLITQPTYSFVGASTITDAATLGIAGAPIKSTNATITNTHGLLIQAGAVSTASYSYGLTVNAQSGASVGNYAAEFLGGNVGIGTATPGAPLHISGSLNNNLIARIENTSTGNSAYSVFEAKNSSHIAQFEMGGTGITGGGAVVYADRAALYTTSGGISFVNDSGVSAGDFRFYNNATNELMRLDSSGNLGIGDTTPDTTLKVVGSICAKADANNCFGSVAGNIYAANFIVDGTSHLPDYVFENNYSLMTMADLKNYINLNHHLPGVASANEVVADGLNLSTMVPALLEKVEENTLYTLQNNDQINSGQQQIADLVLKTDQNITTVQQLQTSVDTQLGVVGTSLNAINQQIGVQTQNLASLQTIATDHETRIKALEDSAVQTQNLTSLLQSQIDALKAQVAALDPLQQSAQLQLNTTDISFLDTLLGVDRVTDPADVDLLGKLSAVGVETGSLTIKVIDPDAPTIGSDKITSVANDSTSDGITVVIKTTAVDSGSKVFVTPKEAIDQPIAVTKIDDGKSFTVSVKNPVTDDLKFDWMIVEAK